MSDTEKNYPGSEKKDGGKKKDGKKDKKEKGYVMFEDGSDEELVGQDDLKSPSKMKKAKAFRFAKKDIFPKVKDDKKEKDGKKEEKEKKEGKKHKLKVKKKSKHREIAVPQAIDKPVFGVTLSVALERNRSHDGIQLPALFRECIDYIEEHGLSCEGIYRISGVKSKVQHLKDSYNRGEPVFLEEHEPNIVASVLKLFLRELPEPVLTNALIPKFEEASTIRNERRRIEGFQKLIKDMPEPNRLLLSWMIVHMTHVIERQKENKMTLQNVSIVLSPTMQISHRVLNVLFSHTKQLFKNTVIKRYIPPLKPATSKWSLELPDNPQALSEELLKQESLLNQLHEELAAGKADPEKEEQIWEVQRICTQLKRKIKLAQKNQENIEKRRKERDEQSKRNTVLEEGEEELNLELREPPAEALNLELRKPPDETEAEQQQQQETEPDIKPDDETQTAKPDKDKDGKSKVTLKELASQSTNKTADTAEKESESESKQAGSETDKVDKESEEVETDKVTTEVKVEPDVEGVSDDTKGVEKDINSDQNIERSKERVRHESGLKDQDGNGDEGSRDDEAEMKADTEGGVAEHANDESEENKLTEDDVREALKNKEALLLQEDTTDSEMGKSQEDIQRKMQESSEDEFEHSLEEILERDLNADSDRDQEIAEEITSKPEEVSAEQETAEEPALVDNTTTPVPMETKTPVPTETPESPPTVTTPVPASTDDQKDQDDDTEPEIVARDDEEEAAISETESFDEEEYQTLLEKMFELKLEEEELMAIESELRKKIATERCETERLQQEIDELQYLRQDSDEEMLSTSSDSSYESEDEDDLQEILSQLIKENEELEKSNSEMGVKIHEERMICLDVKVQIGLLQQKQVQNSAGSDAFNEKESLIEFD